MKRTGTKPVLILDAASAHRTAQQRWTELFGTTAPKRPAGLVEQAVAWREQVMAQGDVPPSVRRDLKLVLAAVRGTRAARALEPRAPCKRHEQNSRTVRDTPRSNARASCKRSADTATAAASAAGSLELPTASSQLLVGTRLVKAYRGKTHVVEVTTGGLLYDGSLFASLSAVAKAITGTHWNGLLFFGLRKRKPYDRRNASA